MAALVYDDAVTGTGCFDSTHITGVYVLPFYQKGGYGSYIMNCLENDMKLVYEIMEKKWKAGY